MPLRTTTTWWGVCLDCPDPQELGRFYQRLLGWQLFGEDDPDDCAVAPSATGGYNIAFQREASYVRPVWPAGPDDPQMQMHLDFEVEDLEQAVAWALESGAELAEHQPQDDVRVMLDPAGHPFCLYLDSSD